MVFVKRLVTRDGLNSLLLNRIILEIKPESHYVEIATKGVCSSEEDWDDRRFWARIYT